MAWTPLPTHELLDMLRVMPARIAEATRGATAEQLHTAPEEGEWSAVEVLAHMRSCADCWGAAITEMLNSEHPTLRAVNPRTWIRSTNYADVPFRRSLTAYTKQRGELVALLDPLPPKAWQRGATVTGAGAPLERTVHHYAQWMAKHERPHLEQLQATVEQVRAR
jgi:hypothetical protein